MKSWLDRVIGKLVPTDTGPDPLNLQLQNTFRELRGEVPISWSEYVSNWRPMTPEGLVALAALIDEARAASALEEAFLCQRPNDKWI